MFGAQTSIYSAMMVFGSGGGSPGVGDSNIILEDGSGDILLEDGSGIIEVEDA